MNIFFKPKKDFRLKNCSNMLLLFPRECLVCVVWQAQEPNVVSVLFKSDPWDSLFGKVLLDLWRSQVISAWRPYTWRKAMYLRGYMKEHFKRKRLSFFVAKCKPFFLLTIMVMKSLFSWSALHVKVGWTLRESIRIKNVDRTSKWTNFFMLKTFGFLANGSMFFCVWRNIKAKMSIYCTTTQQPLFLTF